MFFQIHFKRWYRRTCLLLFGGLLLCCLFVGTGMVEKEVFYPGERTVKLPVLMYHSVCVNKRVKSEYVLMPEKFYADMDYLKKAGYTAVLPSEIKAFVNGEGTLPEKPILITFDDGFYNNLSVCLPKLQECGFKAVMNVVGAYTEQYSERKDENDSYSYLSYDNINTLLASGYIEIGSHTYNMHSLGGRTGCKKMENEDEREYQKTLKEDVEKLNYNLLLYCNTVPEVFAYPFGALCQPAKQVLSQEGFQILLTCEEKINTLTFGEGTPVTLGRINRYASLSTEAFMQKYGI